MSEVAKTPKLLTGKKVLLMVVGFFAVIIAANAYMITLSVKSFRGEDTKKSYLQGLHYNQTLDARAAQKAAGWTAELDYSNKQVRLHIRDGSNASVPELDLTGKLRHPTDTSEDIALEFKEQSKGVYLAEFGQSVIGQRTLMVKTGTDEGFEFSTRNALWLQ